jgi:hypothetical protein
MFQPAGLSVLFPVDLRELTDRDYNARAVVGKPIAELEQRLADCSSFASWVSAADAFLTRRIPEYLQHRPPDDCYGYDTCQERSGPDTRTSSALRNRQSAAHGSRNTTQDRRDGPGLQNERRSEADQT